MFTLLRLYVDPMVSINGASANSDNDITAGAMAGTQTAETDGLELWISVCNTLGSACNNPQNGV